MIRGEKVVLRRKRLEDAWDDYAWKRDPEMARLDATIPLDLPFAVYLANYSEELRYAEATDHRYAIETLDGRHIGNCGCYNLDRFRQQAELGILIGDREYWEKGYGADAVSALVGHVFKERHVKKIYLHTLEDNARAQRCFEKCGFAPRGRVVRGAYKFIIMEIKKPEAEPDGTRE